VLRDLAASQRDGVLAIGCPPGPVRTVASELGSDIRLRGAASLAFHGCLSNPELLAMLCRIPVTN
jgi:hypothetical protein